MAETHSESSLCVLNRLLNTFSITPDDVFSLSETFTGWIESLISLPCFLFLVLLFV